MKRGQSSPSSKESTVPETAPTAKSTAVPRAHRRARSAYTALPVRRKAPSARTIRTGIPIPATANRMWKTKKIAIWMRARISSDMSSPPTLLRLPSQSTPPAGESPRTRVGSGSGRPDRNSRCSPDPAGSAGRRRRRPETGMKNPSRAFFLLGTARFRPRPWAGTRWPRTDQPAAGPPPVLPGFSPSAGSPAEGSYGRTGLVRLPPRMPGIRCIRSRRAVWNSSMNV